MLHVLLPCPNRHHCYTVGAALWRHAAVPAGEEAELVAMSRAAAQTLGLISLAADFGERLKGHILADSSSALAVVARRGAGKLRHINITH